MEKTFDFKPTQKNDLPLLFEWLELPHVAQWWRESRDWETFSTKYLKKIFIWYKVVRRLKSRH